MSAWLWVLDVVGALLGLILLYAVGVFGRRRWLSRSGGTFDLSFRADTDSEQSQGGGSQDISGRGWTLGIGRYSGDRLDFFRIFSLAPAPKVSYVRTELRYTGQRPTSGREAEALYTDHVIVSCSGPDGRFELAMSPGAVTGFLAWVEAGPPGDRGRDFGGATR